MAKRKKVNSSIANHTKLTIRDVHHLGKALIDVADKFPTRFLTERDFFPLIHAYLSGRVPNMRAEEQARHGRIDFRLGGGNPTWLELAVQPRALKDNACDDIVFPGHSQKNSLYVAQNRTELKKLLKEPSGKTRFLLLLDMVGSYGFESLKETYRAAGKKITAKHPVQVVYVSRTSGTEDHFIVKGK